MFKTLIFLQTYWRIDMNLKNFVTRVSFIKLFFIINSYLKYELGTFYIYAFKTVLLISIYVVRSRKIDGINWIKSEAL